MTLFRIPREAGTPFKIVGPCQPAHLLTPPLSLFACHITSFLFVFVCFFLSLGLCVYVCGLFFRVKTMTLVIDILICVIANAFGVVIK